MTLREAAVRLARIASEIREVAGRLDGTDAYRADIARELRAVAFGIDRRAGIAARKGEALGEPEPELVLVAHLGEAVR